MHKSVKPPQEDEYENDFEDYDDDFEASADEAQAKVSIPPAASSKVVDSLNNNHSKPSNNTFSTVSVAEAKRYLFSSLISNDNSIGQFCESLCLFAINASSLHFD